MSKKTNWGYLISVVLLLFILPLASVLFQATGNPNLGALIGKWFTFWAIGCRLFLAGLRQVFQPTFTAQQIFDIKDKKSHVIVRELGFANLCIGLAGILSLFLPGWTIPAAFTGGLYYGLAGLLHLTKKIDSTNERIALITDVLIFLIIAIYLIDSFLR